MTAQKIPGVAKSGSERIADLRARRALESRFEVRGLFAHADDHSEIKAAALRIALRRERVEKRAARAARKKDVTVEESACGTRNEQL